MLHATADRGDLLAGSSRLRHSAAHVDHPGPQTTGTAMINTHTHTHTNTVMLFQWMYLFLSPQTSLKSSKKKKRTSLKGKPSKKVVEVRKIILTCKYCDYDNVLLSCLI